MSTREGRLDGSGIRVALVVSRFNDLVTAKLLSGAEDCLERHGCTAEQRTVVRVPGAWEIAQASKKLATRGEFDAIVGLGALIRGETPHFDYLAAQVSRGLAQIGLDSGIPTIFGVLTTDTIEQAMSRAGAKTGNKGWEAALSALEMVNLFRDLERRSPD
jgi:6,7-dimethyl-8-ribityllumazine synthase